MMTARGNLRASAGGLSLRWRGARWALSLLSILTLRGMEVDWNWSNPRPHGNSIYDMTLFQDYRVQVGEKGRVYYSADLQSWSLVALPTTRPLRAAVPFRQHLLVVGASGITFRSEAWPSFSGTNLLTDDWLEGVAASTDLAVAVGDNGAIYTTSDGSSWTRRPQSFDTWLRSVAYGAGVFVAVGENGLIASSADGLVWRTQKSGVTTHLNRIVWTGALFYVAGNSGRLLTSPDGSSWTPASLGATGDLYAAAASGDTVVVAGESEVWSKSGKAAWSNQLAPARAGLPAWDYYSALTVSNRIVLSGRSGVIVSAEVPASGQVTWANLGPSVRTWLWDAMALPNLYVAVGDLGTVMTAVTPADWQLEVVPSAVTSSILLGVGGTTNRLVAVGDAGLILVSTNAATGTALDQGINGIGIVWNLVEPRPTAYDLQGVAASADLCVVTGARGTILTSSDGRTWRSALSTTTAYLSGAAAHPAGFTAVGDDGTLLASLNGTDWHSQTSGTTNWLYRVRYLNGRLVAVGQNGAVLVSDDSSSWQRRDSGTSVWLNDVVVSSGHYFIAGSGGLVLHSTDTLAWSPVPTLTGKSFYGAAALGDELVLVGLEGMILRGNLALDPKPVHIAAFRRAGATNSYRFLGPRSQRFVLEHSLDLSSWTPAITLEIPASADELDHTEEVPSSPAEFYRTRLVP